jgi:hypothetical protein
MPRPARGFCFGGTAPPKSATYARAREGRPRYSPLGNGCIAQRYAQAREGRRLFCPLEKGGRNHAEPFFVPDMAMKPHKPVPGTGAADFACPPPCKCWPPHGPPRSASRLRTCAPLAGPSGRNRYTGRRGAGVLSAQESAMGSDGEASADLRTFTRAGATLRCLLCGASGAPRGKDWGKRF